MSAYTTVGQTTRRDSGNGARGTATLGGSTLGVRDADGKFVAYYERNDARWGGTGLTLARFLNPETGKWDGRTMPPAGFRTLRQWFIAECRSRYGVTFSR